MPAKKITVKQLVNIAMNVRRLRKLKGLSQLHLAIELKCSESFVSGIECSRYSDISLLTLNKIIMLFDISLEELLNE